MQVVNKQPAWVWIVGITLLAVIVFIFMPVSMSHGTPANRVRCISNIKQLTLGTFMYAGDFDGKLPARDAWMDLSEPFLKSPEVEHCSLVADPNLYGYSRNAALLRDDEPQAETKPLIYDSVNLARNASDLVNSLPAEGRHQGYNNIAYLDGHAKWKRLQR
jgi:prepilin-type processing-associated H-X9-DG protein